jgi:hypothetical protein
MAKVKRQKPGPKPTGAGRKPGRPPKQEGAAAALKGLQAYRDDLAAQRAALEEKLDAVERALQVMGAPSRFSAARRPGRPAGSGVMRPGSLKAHIADVLADGDTMAVKDITDAVVRSGYKTKNKTLAKSVGIALTEMPQVEKVGRGKFRAR